MTQPTYFKNKDTSGHSWTNKKTYAYLSQDSQGNEAIFDKVPPGTHKPPNHRYIHHIKTRSLASWVTQISQTLHIINQYSPLEDVQIYYVGYFFRGYDRFVSRSDIVSGVHKRINWEATQRNLFEHSNGKLTIGGTIRSKYDANFKDHIIYIADDIELNPDNTSDTI